MTFIYEEIGEYIGRLVDKKQQARGRSFDRVGEILTILYPSVIRPEQYEDLGAMVRILDKFFRIATKKQASGENHWQDVAGYALLMNRDLLKESERAAETPAVAADRATFLAPWGERHRV